MNVKNILLKMISLTICAFLLISLVLPVIVKASSLTDLAQKKILRTIEDIEKNVDDSKYPGYKDKLMKLKEMIENYKPYNEQEENDKKIMLKYIDSFDDVLTRNNEFGHFTASSWVVNKEKTKLLMIYHNIYQSWSWTGGHADGDVDLLGFYTEI